MSPSSTEKNRIRKRDRQNIPLTGTCIICGTTGKDTSRHHLWYPKQFDPNAVIEVCDKCDDKIHGRENAETLGQTINAIRDLTIEDGDVWLGGSRIGVADFDENGNISIDMRKR